MRYFITACLLILGINVYSQQYIDTNNPKDQEIKSLLNKDNELNGFGGASLKLGDVNQERTLLVGAYGGVLINRNFMLGIVGYGIATGSEFDGILPDGTQKTLNIHGGYGGLLIGGTLFSRELIHLNIPIILGAGAIYISDQDFFQSSLDTDFTIETSACFVVEPGAELEFNLTTGLRFSVGATYRYVHGLELRNLTSEDLTDWTAVVAIRFGRF